MRPTRSLILLSMGHREIILNVECGCDEERAFSPIVHDPER